MLTGLCAAFGAFVLFLAGVLIRFNLPRLGRRMRAMTGLWLLMLPAYGIIYWIVGKLLPGSLVGCLNGLLVYFFLFLTYCYCYFCTDHSLSVVFMMKLEKTPDKRFTLDGLKRAVPYDALLQQRLADLCTNGFVVPENNSYRLTAKGQRNARLAAWFKDFLRLGAGG